MCSDFRDLSDVDRITEAVKEFLSKTDSDSPTEKRKSPDVDGELVQWNEIIDYVKEYYDSDNLCSGSENAYANGGMHILVSYCSLSLLLSVKNLVFQHIMNLCH